jgi:hypothetical protein
MTPKDPRHTYPYQRARARFIKSQPNGTPCSMCGKPIDTSLRGDDPAGPTIEHTVPVRDAPEVALDVTLWRLAHARCQGQQGAYATHDRRRGRNAPVTPEASRGRPWISWERQWFDGGPYIPPGK